MELESFERPKSFTSVGRPHQTSFYFIFGEGRFLKFVGSRDYLTFIHFGQPLGLIRLHFIPFISFWRLLKIGGGSRGGSLKFQPHLSLIFECVGGSLFTLNIYCWNWKVHWKLRVSFFVRPLYIVGAGKVISLEVKSFGRSKASSSSSSSKGDRTHQTSSHFIFRDIWEL